jgi:hypothetical protein
MLKFYCKLKKKREEITNPSKILNHVILNQFFRTNRPYPFGWAAKLLFTMLRQHAIEDYAQGFVGNSQIFSI